MDTTTPEKSELLKKVEAELESGMYDEIGFCVECKEWRVADPKYVECRTCGEVVEHFEVFVKMLTAYENLDSLVKLAVEEGRKRIAKLNNA